MMNKKGNRVKGKTHHLIACYGFLNDGGIGGGGPSITLREYKMHNIMQLSTYAGSTAHVNDRAESRYKASARHCEAATCISSPTLIIPRDVGSLETEFKKTLPRNQTKHENISRN
jgi:hypothetical protein